MLQAPAVAFRMRCPAPSPRRQLTGPPLHRGVHRSRPLRSRQRRPAPPSPPARLLPRSARPAWRPGAPPVPAAAAGQPASRSVRCRATQSRQVDRVGSTIGPTVALQRPSRTGRWAVRLRTSSTASPRRLVVGEHDQGRPECRPAAVLGSPQRRGPAGAGHPGSRRHGRTSGGTGTRPIRCRRPPAGWRSRRPAAPRHARPPRRRPARPAPRGWRPARTGASGRPVRARCRPTAGTPAGSIRWPEPAARGRATWSTGHARPRGRRHVQRPDRAPMSNRPGSATVPPIPAERWCRMSQCGGSRPICTDSAERGTMATPGTRRNFSDGSTGPVPGEASVATADAADSTIITHGPPPAATARATGLKGPRTCRWTR